MLFRSFRVRMEMISSISCMISARTGVAGSFQPALSSLASHGPFFVEGLSPLHYCLNPLFFFFLFRPGDGQEVNPLPAPLRR